MTIWGFIPWFQVPQFQLVQLVNIEDSLGGMLHCPLAMPQLRAVRGSSALAS